MPGAYHLRCGGGSGAGSIVMEAERTVTRELIRMGLLKELKVDDLLDMPDLFVEHFGIRRGGEQHGAGG